MVFILYLQVFTLGPNIHVSRSGLLEVYSKPSSVNLEVYLAYSGFVFAILLRDVEFDVEVPVGHRIRLWCQRIFAYPYPPTVNELEG
jgi:hypothetical protein